MKKLSVIALMVCSMISVHAATFTYSVSFSGANESPTNNSAGIGSGTVIYDDVAHSLSLGATFSGLTGTTTAAHIHAPTVDPFVLNAGVATTVPSFVGFPLGVTSGTFTNTLDLTQSSSFNPSFVTAQGGTVASAEVALASAMAQGKAYWNIHSSAFGGGEIRGFLIAVPEPSTYALAGLGIFGVATRFWAQRRRKV